MIDWNIAECFRAFKSKYRISCLIFLLFIGFSDRIDYGRWSIVVTSIGATHFVIYNSCHTRMQRTPDIRFDLPKLPFIGPLRSHQWRMANKTGWIVQRKCWRILQCGGQRMLECDRLMQSNRLWRKLSVHLWRRLPRSIRLPEISYVLSRRSHQCFSENRMRPWSCIFGGHRRLLVLAERFCVHTTAIPVPWVGRDSCVARKFEYFLHLSCNENWNRTSNPYSNTLSMRRWWRV